MDGEDWGGDLLNFHLGLIPALERAVGYNPEVTKSGILKVEELVYTPNILIS